MTSGGGVEGPTECDNRSKRKKEKRRESKIFGNEEGGGED